MRPEFRRDPLYDTWVVFAPERQRRPIELAPLSLPLGTNGHIDPLAYGNEAFTPGEVYAVRAKDSKPNTSGWSVRVVPNRFPAMKIEGDLHGNPVGLYDQLTGIGAHEIIIETPQSGQPFHHLSAAAMADVLVSYQARMIDLNKDPRFAYLFVFKNVGALAGASLSHAHSQLVALPVVPPAVEGKMTRARNHYSNKKRSLFADILCCEKQEKKRLVTENNSFVLFCPFASRFPFEMAIFPRRHNCDFTATTGDEFLELADILRFALTRLEAVLENPGYNLLLHTAPLRRQGPDGIDPYASARFDYSWHLEITPRLSSYGGFEIGLGSHINTIFPEEAAAFLRGDSGL